MTVLYTVAGCQPQGAPPKWADAIFWVGCVAACARHAARRVTPHTPGPGYELSSAQNCRCRRTPPIPPTAHENPSIARVHVLPRILVRAQTPAAAYSPEQLDQLLGPIALYPDPLVAIILPASTVSFGSLARRGLSGGQRRRRRESMRSPGIRASRRWPATPMS